MLLLRASGFEVEDAFFERIDAGADMGLSRFNGVEACEVATRERFQTSRYFSLKVRGDFGGVLANALLGGAYECGNFGFVFWSDGRSLIQCSSIAYAAVGLPMNPGEALCGAEFREHYFR